MKKPYAIERRIKTKLISPEDPSFWVDNGFTKWHKCKSYATAKDRDKALAALLFKPGVFEYRVKTECPYTSGERR